MGKKLGKAIIKVDGQALETLPGSSLDLGGSERETLIGENQVLGFSEKPKQGILKCKIPVGTDTKLASMSGWDNVTISFECDTGQQYVGQGYWLTNTQALTAGKGGEVELQFEGPPAQEMM